MNSSTFRGLVAIQLGSADVAARSYEVGISQRTPVPVLSGELGSRLSLIAQSAVVRKRLLDTANETSHVFLMPSLLQTPGSSLKGRIEAFGKKLMDAESELVRYQNEIDDLAFSLYGIDPQERRKIEEQEDGLRHGDDDRDEQPSEDDVAERPITTDHRLMISDIVSHAVGWRIRSLGNAPQRRGPSGARIAGPVRSAARLFLGHALGTR